MFEKYSTLVAKGFKNDPRLLTARDKAFREVVNDISVFNLDMQQNRGKTRTIPVESKCPELLANFCDLILRRGNFSKRMRSEEIDARLEEVVSCLCSSSWEHYFPAACVEICRQQGCIHAVLPISSITTFNFGHFQ